MRGSIRGFRSLKQKCCLWLGVCLAVFFIYRLIQSYSSPKRHLVLELDDEDPPFDDGKKHYHRWVVVTTINHPTPSLVELSRLPGWKMLVVGDLKTPKEWKIKDVIYLNLEDQKKLKYAINTFLPYGSYSRKMIGYLYAIQHGAKIIYETDDDNTLSEGFFKFLKIREANDNKILFVDTHNLTFNPYPHFGQPSLWPRGYPLEYVSHSQPSTFHLEDVDRVTVFQGLTSRDPDVDAVFRLTRVAQHSRLNITFDNAAPPVGLPPGTFCPFNSQNTVYTYDVFWALFLPVTVTSRVCDIWRAYWAQTLMWLSNQRMAYLYPIGYQIRNKHSLQQDLIDENDLYIKSGTLVKFLHSWKCDALHFFACVSKLTKDMAANSYWKSEEVDILDAWLSDLSSLGYAPPAMVNIKRSSKDRKMTFPVLNIQPNEQSTSMIHSANVPSTDNYPVLASANILYRNMCKKDLTIRMSQSHDILLIIGAKHAESIHMYEILYRPYFSHIIYCVISKKGVFSMKVSVINMKHWNQLLCLQEALKIGYLVKGYYYLGENMILRKHVLETNDKFTVPLLPHPKYIFLSLKSHINSACNNETSRCISILVKDAKNILKRMYSSFGNLSLQQRKCIDDVVVGSKSLKDRLIIQDLALVYIPNTAPQLKTLIWNSDNLNVIYFIIPILFCSHKGEGSIHVLNVNSDTSGDIIFPYAFQGLVSGHRMHTNIFCNYWQYQI